MVCGQMFWPQDLVVSLSLDMTQPGIQLMTCHLQGKDCNHSATGPVIPVTNV